MSRRWSGTLNFSMSARDRGNRMKAMERMSDVDLGGFYVGYSPKNHAGSKFVDLTIITHES
jgi:hypothetical protein